MDPRLKLAMIMLFFQAVQLVMLELERVHQERGRNRRLELVKMARYSGLYTVSVYIDSGQG